MLNEQKLRELLSDNIDLRLLPETGSTNDELKRLAIAGAKAGTVVLTDKQTAGKGRMGRSFFSPRSGVYMSMLLRPDSTPKDALFFTIAAAVAVCRAVEKVSSKTAEIKWVNDVYVDGKKICGILAEGSISMNCANWVVVGIGTNITPPPDGFPPEIADRAGAVFEHGSEPDSISEIYAAELIRQLSDICMSSKNVSDIIGEYRSRSFVVGRELTAIVGETERKCRALEITDDGGLMVEFSDRSREILHSGEVSIRV